MRIFIVKIGEPLLGEGLRVRRMTLFARALVKAGHEVTWWTSDWSHQKKQARSNSLVADSRGEGINLELIHAPAYMRNMSIMRMVHHVAFARRLAARLQKTERPDLVWVCFPVVPVAYLLDKWSKKAKVPIIFDVRDLSPDVIIENIPRRLRSIARLLAFPVYKALGRAFHAASGLTAVSPEYLKWGQRLAARYGPSKNSSVLPLGYESENIEPAEEDAILREFEQLGLSGERTLKLVYAGGFGKSYDIITLLEAARLCQEEGMDVQFLIAGGGEREDEYRQKAAGLSNVLFFGWLTTRRLKVLLSHSQAGIMPYVLGATQGLPNKLYEYMGNDLCIINSLQGEAATFIRMHGVGMSYEPGNPDSFLSIVRDILNSEAAMQNMRKASAAVLDEKFNSAELAKKMVDFAVSCAR